MDVLTIAIGVLLPVRGSTCYVSLPWSDSVATQKSESQRGSGRTMVFVAAC